MLQPQRARTHTKEIKFASFVYVRGLGWFSDQVQVIHNSFRLTMAEKDFPVVQFNPHAPVAPHVGAAFTDAANSVTAQRSPDVHGVSLDGLQRDGTKTEAQRADLHTVSCEAIVEAAPS
jgi:hypothetical protein